MTRKGNAPVVAANPVIAATIAAALVAWDLAEHLPLPLGVAGHEGSTVLAVLNGPRLLRSRLAQRHPGPLPCCASPTT